MTRPKQTLKGLQENEIEVKFTFSSCKGGLSGQYKNNYGWYVCAHTLY